MTVDFIILNDVALHMAKGLTIEDHPPRCMAKNFHAHLAHSLSCQWDQLRTPKDDDAPECYITWVSSMEMTCWAWTESEVFAQHLKTIVTAENESLEALNVALE